MNVIRRTGHRQRNRTTVARGAASASPAPAEDLWPETPELEHRRERRMEDEGMDSQRQIILQDDHDRTGTIRSAQFGAIQALIPNRQTPVVNNGVATHHPTMGEHMPPRWLNERRTNTPALFRIMNNGDEFVFRQTFNHGPWTRWQGDDDNDNPHGWTFMMNEGGDDKHGLNKRGHPDRDGIHRPRPTTRCHGEPSWISQRMHGRRSFFTHGERIPLTMDARVHGGNGPGGNADARTCRWLRRSAFELPATGRPRRRRPDRRVRLFWRCEDV